jgi:hypothetical protein
MKNTNSQKCKKVVISGRSNDEIPAEEIREEGWELWLLGTDPRDGADRYYELHEIPCKHEGAIRELPDEVYQMGLPINNSISALMVHAWQTGYTHIKVKGCAMIARSEYLQQRPAVAYVEGWIKSKGIDIEWTDGPVNIDYGRKHHDTRATEIL